MFVCADYVVKLHYSKRTQHVWLNVSQKMHKGQIGQEMCLFQVPVAKGSHHLMFLS